MESIEVAFQGERGAYSEEAALQLFREEEMDLRPEDSFDAVFRRVAGARGRRGVVPVENSLAGSILRNYDLLLEHDLHVVGETYLRVRHCLLALPGTALADVREVHSHPQALSQCRRSLEALLPGREMKPSHDTAGSAALIRRQELRDAAAVAGRRAGEVYGMEILADGLEDRSENFTRFLVLSRDPAPRPEGPAKTSLVFAAENVPGALHRALEPFARREVDLTKIESRPRRGSPWEYFFYLDVAGAGERCSAAVEELREGASFLRVLGAYPRGDAGPGGGE